MYPSDYIEEVTLRDGSHVTLRPIRPDDAPRLQEGFTHLSPQTIYQRFLETFKQLTDEQARNLASVDYRTRMAMVGSIQEEGEERLVVVARYAMIDPQPDDHGVAEAAIVVRDDYQNRGLGTMAMKHLVRYAREHGVTAFVGVVHMSNARILRFIQRGGFHIEKKMLGPGTWEVLVKLEEQGDASA